MELKRGERRGAICQDRALNRTILELKRYNQTAHITVEGCFKSYHFGIETVGHHPSPPNDSTLNRTILELKHFPVRMKYNGFSSLNRTILELKRIIPTTIPTR